MADALSLLFELDVDSRQGTAGLLAFRKDIAATIDATRRAITQPLKAPDTAPITAAAKAASSAQEKEQRRLNAAVESLQRQRSAALIKAFKDEERAAVASARNQERAAIASAKAQEQAVTASLKAQERAAQAVAKAQAQAQQKFLAGLNSVGQGLKSLGQSLTVGVTAPLTALGILATKNAVSLDSLKRGLTAITGSADLAAAQLERLREIAKAPGIGFQEAIEGSIRLQAVGFAARDAEKELRLFANAIALTGGGRNELERVTVQLGQLAAKGKVVAQDLKPIIEAAPAVGQALLKAFGTVNSEDIQKLGLTTQQFFDRLNGALETLPKAAAGARNAFENFSDSIFVASSAIGEAILPPLTKLINALEPLILQLADKFKALSPTIQTVVVAVAALAAAAGPVLFVLGGIVTGVGTLITALTAIGGAIASIGFPALAAILAALLVDITALTTAAVVLFKAWQTNFLGIQGLVSDAAGAVLKAFNDIKAVFTEATQRILPTLESITSKVVIAITILWERYGKTVVQVVGDSFRFIINVTTTFLRTFSDFIDLVAKLIDSDWKGAWQAFARIVVNGIGGLGQVLADLSSIVERALKALLVFIIAQAVKFVKTANELSAKFITALAAGIVSSAPNIRDALVDMFVAAANGIDPSTIVGILIAKFVIALKKAAAEGVTKAASEADVNVGVDIGLGKGLLRKKRIIPTPPSASDKGADAATKRRIRLLELEADRTEAINRQNIDAERLRFDLREKSLQRVTEDEIRLEREILEKKKAVFAAELVEAQKLGKGRELAVKEINLKSLQAEIEFHNKENQLRVNQQKEEEQAAIEHRKKLLDIQEAGDQREIARLEELSRTGAIDAFQLETRRAEIEAKARQRRRAELETELKEAKENVEERGRIQDELKRFDEESAAATEEGERRKRQALQETVEAYNAYTRAIIEAQAQAAALVREVSIIQLESLRRRVGDRRRILREQFRIEQEDSRAQHEDNKRRIDEEEKAAIEAAKKAGDIERRRLEIEKQFHDLRLAEDDRFNAERRARQEEFERALDPLGPLKDKWDEFKEAVLHVNDSIADSVRSVASQVADSFDEMIDATKQGIVAWLLYGESLGKALKKALAEQLAKIAAECAIQALKHAAYALGSLAFGDFAGAARHAAAAAAFTAAAAATGFAARALAKSAGIYKPSGSTASSAVNGGEPSPRNATFNFNGPGIESAPQAARDGSAGGLFGGFGRVAARLDNQQQQILDLQRQQQLHNAQVNETLARIKTARPGDVVTMGASDARQAIGVAVIDHSNSSGDFNENLQRNLGLA